MKEMMARREDVAREGRMTMNRERGHKKIFIHFSDGTNRCGR